MQSVCKVRSRLEGFLGRFFLVQLVFWLQALSGPGVHGGTGHHGASQGLTGLSGPGVHGGTGHHEASRGFMASTAAQDITRPHEASWHPQGLLSGPASTVRHWSSTLRPRTLARGLKGFCGFCAGSAGPRHGPHTPVRSAPLEFTGDRRGPTLSGEAEPSAASALVNPQTMQLRLPRLALSPTS